MELEKPLSCAELSKLLDGAITEENLRLACQRPADKHPLPHTRIGSGKRPIIKIRPSVFERWYSVEERLQVS